MIKTKVFKNKIKSLVPKGIFRESSTASISIPSNAPPLRKANPIPKPMIIPPTTVTSNVSPSIIVGTWCIRIVPIANEAMPIIE
ncbi:hypothetical protein D3C73_1241730 [compost metagenome]